MNREKIKRWIVLSLLVALATSSCGGSTAAPEVGAQAPGFTISTLDGETVTLNELRGQPVLLNFWATWCGYCRYQMPFLKAAFEEKGQEMNFIAINIGEDIDKVQQYAEAEGLGFTVAVDSEGDVVSAYKITSIPATFFIDEQGVIKYIQIGAFMSQDELMAALEDL
ncbi:MAG: redoxin domain-containing protein [Dehalococcoidia bacterium]|nr:redoxin domain-containing protein [Dehalococcoidia bacterium]